MSTKETLQEARELIADPKDWCTGHLAIEEHAPYCALGAVMKASNWQMINWIGAVTTEQQESFDAAASALAKVIDVAPVAPYFSSVAQYNNAHSHECVLAMFDAAIEKEAS